MNPSCAIRHVLLSTLITLTSPVLSAITAYRGSITVDNNGTPVTIYLHGDENFHYYTDADGRLLDYNKGTLTPHKLSLKNDVSVQQRYIDSLSVACAGIRTLKLRDMASRAVPAARVGLFPGTHFPVTGEQKALVVLVEYKDVQFTLDNPYDYFSRMLNEPGFSDYDATGSARDYFIDNSCGQFLPQFDVVGPVTLPEDRAFYGANNILGNDVNAEQMVIDACRIIDSYTDFSQYDRDGDGFIDNIFIFYAGRGEASGGPDESVWPHSYNITKASSTPVMLDGVQLDYYACTNEWTRNRPDGIGTFVHEFSHVMGLPDLYATNEGGTAFTPGAWSAMDYGPYNNSGCTPPMYSVFERYALGWIDPVEISGETYATLPPIGDNVAGIMSTSSSHEFFLVENRQQQSWDTYVPGHGMLVWHIDYSPSVWTRNTVNNNARHQCVDLMEADNNLTAETRGGDCFPGTMSVTSFTDDTEPAMRTWDNKPMNRPFTDITEQGGEVSFAVMGGSALLQPPVALQATDVTANSATAVWEAAGVDRYRVDLYTTADGNEPVHTAFRYADNATSVTFECLEPETFYSYTVRACRGLEMSAPSTAIDFYTGRMPISANIVKLIEPEDQDMGSDCFTVRWEPVVDATDYLVTLYTMEPGRPMVDAVGFDDKLNLPQGWSTDATATYAMASYCGASVPSLRLSSGQQLVSPVYDMPVSAVSLWHRGNSTSEGDCIRVEAMLPDGTYKSVTDLTVVRTAGGRHDECTDLPDDTKAVRLSYLAAGDRGSLALDDVSISWGYVLEPSPVGKWDNVSVGDVTECEFTGLQSGTEYYVTVTATDGTQFSRPSVPVKVTLAGGAGIISIPGGDSNAMTEYYNLQGIRISGNPGPGIYIMRKGNRVSKVRIN